MIPTMCEFDFSVLEGIWDSCTRVLPAVKYLVLKDYTKKKELVLSFFWVVYFLNHQRFHVANKHIYHFSN